jgi:hypothetical protein
MIIPSLEASKPTAADILAILRDHHRHASQVDPEVDSDFDLSFDSTIQEWREACDLLDWQPLALWLNEHWKMALPIATWREHLAPPKQRRLRNVCELIAAHGTVEIAVAPKIFGRECAPAGIFFAVRELLERDGADVHDLRPSSKLSAYSADYYQTLAGPVSQLAPGLLPAIGIKHPAYDRASCGLGVCLLGLAVTAPFVLWAPLLPFSLLAAAGFFGLWSWCAARMTPASVTFGNLETIRDLCVALAPGVRGAT